MNEQVTLTQENTVRPLRLGGSHLRDSFDDNGMFYELPKVVGNDAGMYEVVVGRWRVLQTLFEGGYANIEAELVDWDADQQAVANLSSNMTASTNWQVDPWDVKALIDNGRQQKDVARLIGCSPPKISQLMTVFNPVPGLQDKIRAGLLKGRDNILKCDRLPKADQEALAKMDGVITSADIRECLNKKKVKPLVDLPDDDVDYEAAFDVAESGRDYTSQGLVIAGARLDDLLAGEVVDFEMDGQVFKIQLVEVVHE